eukprot:CAMPEP_0170479726 /NCGR_PEP_ID=MMETSP0208-20121228/847_1 /TAXON_ID=197538 /ORGANISM="Strombidium inclinatum, Strain S3" /LENGTH=134 /DNA_ID=CAMNT_0010752173 /DNA_START=36 /DNA_END=440 /DNA_ORIENTATION=+
MSKFVCYVTKLVKNPLLGRKQMGFQLIHPEQGSVSKAAIKEKLAQMFKSSEKLIGVFGLQSKFGGGRSSGFACIYDSEEARKKYDQKKILKRDGLWDQGKVPTRKQKKEMKGRMNKVRGTAKAKAAAATGKKKK